MAPYFGLIIDQYIVQYKNQIKIYYLSITSPFSRAVLGGGWEGLLAPFSFSSGPESSHFSAQCKGAEEESRASLRYFRSLPLFPFRRPHSESPVSLCSNRTVANSGGIVCLSPSCDIPGSLAAQSGKCRKSG